MNRIDELKAKIDSMERGQNARQSAVWGVLDEKTKELTPQEAQAINGTKEVTTSYEAMMAAFTGYFLFPKFRDEFASIPAFKPLCDKYISSVLRAKADRYKHTAELEEENLRLKQELAALKGGDK